MSRGRFNLLLLMQGQFVTSIGSQIYDVAMLLWIKELTGSAAIMGIAMLLTGLPEALLAPFGGRLADRFGLLRTLILSDLVSAAAVGCVLFAIFSDVGPAVAIAMLCAGNLVLGFTASCFGPAVSALIPTLVSVQNLEKGNAALQFCGVGGRVIGQGLGGLLYAFLGIGGTILINMISYFGSALSELTIRLPVSTHEPSTRNSPLIAETRQMLRQVWADPAMRTMLLLIAALHLCLSCLPILLPYYSEHVLRIADTWFGLFMATYTGGILLGFVAAGSLNPTERRFHRIAWSAGAVGLLFALLATTSSALVATALLLGIGIGIGIVIVNLMTALQLAAPETERGGIMGAAQAIGGGSLPAGMAITGLVYDGLLQSGLSHSGAARFILATAAAIAIGAAVGAISGRWNNR